MEVNEQPVSQMEESNVYNDSSEAEAGIEKDNLIGFPILFSLNGLYGYLDRQLQVLIPPIYDLGINYTTHGYAWVRYQEQKNKSECLIFNRDGEIVFRVYAASITILYDDIISYTPEGEQLHKVIKFMDDIDIIDRLGGVPAPSKNGIMTARLFDTNEWVFFDYSGNRILPELELKRMSRSFQEDRAVVVLGENRDIRIIDNDGNFYGNLEFYRTGRNFSEGLLPAETKDGYTGYVNKDGKFAFYVPIVADIPNYDESPLNATDFIGGHALIQSVLDPPTWRIINNQGKYISDELPISSAYAFRDELSCVRLNDNSYAYINTRGEYQFDLIFDKADSFYQGYARVVFHGRDGLINTKGEIFWCDEIVSKNKE